MSNFRWRPDALATLGVVLVLGALHTACVDSRCTRDSECPTGEVCQTATGSCVVPECISTGSCPQGTVCKDFACVTGCRTSAECAENETCFDERCVEMAGDCECPVAPGFCELDVNPRSPTAGDEICLSKSFPTGALLFFGSVKCSHCRYVYDALLTMQQELKAEGDDPRIVWMQLKDVQVDADDVESALGDQVVEPIIQDTDALELWTAYDADWYDVVLIDSHGCLAAHMGPLTDEQINGDLHEDLKGAWRKAMSADCAEGVPDVTEAAPDAGDPESTREIVELPDVVDETNDDTAEDTTGAENDETDASDAEDVSEEIDATEALEVAEVADAPELLELPEVTDSGSDADEASAELIAEASDVSELPPEAWVEPFVLEPQCQVVDSAPSEVGEPIPHFLCMDINPTSPTHEEPVTELSLHPRVWIAYFGSCT